MAKRIIPHLVALAAVLIQISNMGTSAPQVQLLGPQVACPGAGDS